MKREKKRIVTIILLSLLALLLVFFVYKESNAYHDLSKTDLIYITNGGNGDMMKLTDETEVTKVVEYIDNLNYIYMPSLSRGGYDYAISFYNKDTHLVKYVFCDDTVKIDGTNYRVLNGNDSTLEELLQSLSSSEFQSEEE